MNIQEVFAQELRAAMDRYIPTWTKNSNSSAIYGITNRKLYKWINGEDFPELDEFENFLGTVIHLNPLFSPITLLSLRDLYHKASYERNPQALEGAMYVGSGQSVYDITFNDLCQEAEKEIVVFKNWMVHTHRLPINLISAIKRNVRTRILLTHPSSIHVEERLRERKTKSNSEQKTSLENIREIILNNKLYTYNKFELRFHNFTPPFTMYLVDDKILFTQYWHATFASNGPYLQVGSGTTFGKEMEKTVNKIWDRSSAISVSDAMNFIDGLEERKWELKERE